jgi:hypothetical protein
MNRSVGWWSLAAGVLSGLVLGLWSFDGPLPVPAFLGEYGDTSRRLARLGHIAFIGLGLINLLIDRELTASALGAASRRLASVAMNAGNVLLPPTLFAAAAWRPAKYAMALPATCVLVALVLVAWGTRAGSRS